MTEAIIASETPSRKQQFTWTTGVLFKPRKTFALIVSVERSWMLPLLIFTIATLARVLFEGSIRQALALAGGLPLPPDFQYYPPDMQARYMQAIQATQSPVFFYVFPSILAVLGIWVGWLLVSGLLHLSLTLLGGRGDTAGASNIVAWASMPFVLRELVRLVALLVTRQLISSPGLSGFVAADVSGAMAYLGSLLTLIDIYLVWHIILLVIGARAATSLPTGKAVTGVLGCLILVVALQALLGYLGGLLGDLTVIRPFF
jgi:hypothetical protein